MEADWTAKSKEAVSIRLLDMWLDYDIRRVVLNGVCGYVPTEEIRAGCQAAVRDLEAKGIPKTTEIMLRPRFIRLAGHLHSIAVPPVPISLLSQVHELLVQHLTELVDRAAQRALDNNSDLIVALERHNLSPTDVGMKPSDCILMLQM